MVNDVFLTSNEVCSMFKITRRTLNRWLKNHSSGNIFPAPTIKSEGGSQHLFATIDVMSWIESCKSNTLSQ